jgi:hypothetical protein
MSPSDSRRGPDLPSRASGRRLAPPPPRISRVASAPLAGMLSPIPRRTRRLGLFGLWGSPCETDGDGLPLEAAGSASAMVVSGPARRSPRPGGHHYGLPARRVVFNDPLTSKASADSLPPRLFRLLPGGTINFPGGTRTRWRTAPFHGARLPTLFFPGNGFPTPPSTRPSNLYRVDRRRRRTLAEAVPPEDEDSQRAT